MSTPIIQWSTPQMHSTGLVAVSRDVEISVAMSESGQWYAVCRTTSQSRQWYGYIGIHAPGRHETPEAAAAAAMDLVPLVETLHQSSADYIAALTSEGDDA